MKTTVLYHNDPDGFCSSWVASKYLPSDTEHHPVNHYQEPPWDIIDGREVYILDFSYPRPAMEKVIRRAGRLVCLDHHVSAKKALAGLPGCHFDMNHSGCQMTWRYFEGIDYSDIGGRTHFNRVSAGYWRDRKWLVDYTEDRDLWCFKLPDSHEIDAHIRSLPFDYEEWNDVAALGIHHAVHEGTPILRAERGKIERMLKGAREVNLGDYSVWAVNTPVLGNECIQILAKKPLKNGKTPPFAVSWKQIADGDLAVSVGSVGDFDVSEFAGRFEGGGGHQNASGFKCHPSDPIGMVIMGLMEGRNG